MSGPVSRRAGALGLGAYLVLRLWLGTLPGAAADTDDYKRWALGAARHGLAAVYDNSAADYPPVFVFVLWGLGKLYLLFDPAAVPEKLPGTVGLTLLIKSPHLAADLALAALLARLVSGGLWGRARSGPGWGRLAGLLYLWNPAVLWVSAYWGQPDGLHSCLALAALGALGARPALSGGLLALAGLTKPVAVPLVPVLAGVAAARRGLRGFLAAGLGGLVAALLVFAPFLVTGRGLAVVRRVLGDSALMPLTSSNAHNFWWFYGGWRDARVSLVGPVTAERLGWLLFGGMTGLLLARNWSRLRRDDADAARARTQLLGAGAAAAFFFFSTHLHENHLFLALVLFLALAGRSRALGGLCWAASLAVLVNAVLHDPLVTRLPGALGWSSPVIDPFLGRPYTWLQLVGSYANAGLVGAITAGVGALAWSGRVNDPP
ncbi:MAG TPA: hypothetical protein VJS92_15585 [Candidatus Polarisedimenticolaceae bacterium]|nr:hypothetical protein [Candidatus Polarisedimenticolaceae bacterium]